MDKEKRHILELRDLTIGFGESNPLVKEINLGLHTGELVGLIAENGKGKSTLLKTITGNLSPLSGKVLLYSQNIEDISVRERAMKLSTVFTDRVRINNLSVAELIAFGRYPFINWLARLNDEDREIIDNAARLCKVSHLMQKNFLELSDGEQQKVLIARAIAQQTPIIVLDEPTIHLDLLNRAEVLHILSNLVRETKKTILFSTHQIELVIQVADRLLVIDEGKLIDGPPRKLVESGLIEKMFSREGILFDPKSGTFQLDIQEGRN